MKNCLFYLLLKNTHRGKRNLQNHNPFTQPILRVDKFEEIFEFPEETEYPPLENILILEEVQEEKPNLSLQVNILAAEKLVE